jgi:NAD-reducing hydrogenase large subunit
MAHPETAKRGVLLRKFGQEVIRVTAGKRVHGTGAVPGGVNKSLTVAERDELLKDAYQIVQWSRDAVHLIQKVHTQDPGLYNSFGIFRSNFMSLVGHNGDLDFYDGTLRARDDNGNLIFDHLDYQTTTSHRGRGAPWSYMKFPSSVHRQGARLVQGRPAGPRAELRPDPTPFAEHERKEFVDYAGGAPLHAPLAYHWARMIEMLHAAEVIKELLHDDDLLSDDLMVRASARWKALASSRRRAARCSTTTAWTTTTCHHGNLIVSTTNNNQAMNEAVRHVARRYLHGAKSPKACSTTSKSPSAPSTPACPAPPMRWARCRWRSSWSMPKAGWCIA